MSDLNELFERVKKATGPDRKLDIAIARQTHHPSMDGCNPDHDNFIMAGSKMDRRIPAFTASIDAALALVERVLPGWPQQWAEMLREAMDDLWAETSPQMPIIRLPLAILAALLSALISKESRP